MPNNAPQPKARPIQVLSYDEIESLIASHRGKVVVLDAWATYCRPCLKEFPHLVELHKQYGSEKVACISLSFDNDEDVPLEEAKPKVQQWLDKFGATFDNIMSSDSYQVLYKNLDFQAIPAVFVYGTDGKLIERVDHKEGSVMYDRVKVVVEQQLADQS